MHRKRILVAALNWGLGHATRCIPIIKQLHQHEYEPVIASDGPALEILKKEFPHFIHLELPSYNIQYSRNGASFKWKMMMNSPRIINAIAAEKKLTEEIVRKYQIQGIISDNRLGVRSKKLKKNVFLTHQLNVLSGNTSFLSSYLHQNYIRKFDQCWVPDFEGETNLSGMLGHLSKKPGNVKYMGVISRFKKQDSDLIYDFLILLSGPEPQRSLLESKLLLEFERTPQKILFVRGVLDDKPTNISPNPNINIKNYMFGKALEEAINCSRYVVSRSGYTTLMDLSKLNKKAFFIPTPGQSEQEYLAERLQEQGISPYCNQNEFELAKLEELDNYKGLRDLGNGTAYGDLFAFFEGE